jgi:hypothetical protein
MISFNLGKTTATCILVFTFFAEKKSLHNISHWCSAIGEISPDMRRGMHLESGCMHSAGVSKNMILLGIGEKESYTENFDLVSVESFGDMHICMPFGVDTVVVGAGVMFTKIWDLKSEVLESEVVDIVNENNEGNEDNEGNKDDEADKFSSNWMLRTIKACLLYIKDRMDN